MLSRLLTLCGSCLIASCAFSHPISSTDPWTSRVYMGINGGSLGARGEIGYYFNDTFRLRFAGGGIFFYKKKITYEDVDYHDVKFRPMTFLVFADWYFLKGWGFRVTGGMGYNRTKITLKKTYTMGTLLGRDDAPYTSQELGKITAKYRFREFVPYVGGGYDSPRFFGNRVSFNIEAGALFQGKVRAKVHSTGIAADDPRFKKRSKEEAEDLMNKNKWVKVYPVIMVGVNFHLC